MKRSGAWLVRHALEQLPIEHTFGIPGVHNTELYDELHKSSKITPILVTHECHAGFMADAVSRTSSNIGCLLIVPGAGVTHAASAIAEAFLDGIPLLIIAGGIRSDSQFSYQLHDIAQHPMLAPITKAQFKVESHQQLISTIFQAYNTAIDGVPGPVFVEVPVNLQLDKGTIDTIPNYAPPNTTYEVDKRLVSAAVSIIDEAKQVGLFVGWGAVDARKEVEWLAEYLAAPVATSLQGLSSFSSEHPLHCGFGFGEAAVPAARNAFKDCDCLIAIGVKFSEVGTGSYGIQVPQNLIHIDIDKTVINRNYNASVGLIGDAKQVLVALRAALEFTLSARDQTRRLKQIAEDKRQYLKTWETLDQSEKVNPMRFFEALKLALDDDAIISIDDGNHTFLSAELMSFSQPRQVILPTDFNCMGYAVPAAIGAKLTHPEKQVISIVGDGAFLMSGIELAGAAANNIGSVNFVFSDGELAQISQAQDRTYSRKTCTQLNTIDLSLFAQSNGCDYVKIENNQSIASNISRALEIAEQGRPVVVDINIDYSKPTCFTQGVIKTNLKRLSLNTKVRMVNRALLRKLGVG
ncbi:thiamine pyrophosphate-binding protein [Aliikangiella sp. IMCC44653]